MKKTLLFISSLLLSTSLSAATWSITDLKTGTDGGFGFSSLHDASNADADNNVMTGSKLVDITGASGTYDDVTGAVDFSFTLSNSDTLALTGNLLFDAAGWLSDNSKLAYSGLNLTGVAASGDFGFKPGDVCCNGAADPNSFMASGNGDSFFMTLWGADGFDMGAYANSTVGMDFRVELSEVPIPAALWLFAPALAGFMGLRRKTKA